MIPFDSATMGLTYGQRIRTDKGDRIVIDDDVFALRADNDGVANPRKHARALVLCRMDNGSEILVERSRITAVQSPAKQQEPETGAQGGQK